MPGNLFKASVQSRGFRAGPFVKTPAVEIVELLALAGVDFICLDAEHAPFGRRELDLCLAAAKARSLTALVRTESATQAAILQALDGGAAGLLVPHVDSVEKARDIARWAHFGPSGRGFSGSVRAADFTSVPMKEVLRSGKESTLVIAQIEDAQALEQVEDIAAVDGIDGLFFGAADFGVSLGLDSSTGPEIDAALDRILAAASRVSKPVGAYAATSARMKELRDRGVSLVLVGSDQSLILSGGREIAAAARENSDR